MISTPNTQRDKVRSLKVHRTQVTSRIRASEDLNKAHFRKINLDHRIENLDKKWVFHQEVQHGVLAKRNANFLRKETVKKWREM